MKKRLTAIIFIFVVQYGFGQELVQYEEDFTHY